MACVSRISEEELKIIALMERRGVLQRVDGHRLPTRDGAILLFCGDADQSIDLLGQSLRAIFVEGDRARPHLLADNGGALLLPCASPLYDEAIARHYLDSIKRSRQLKEIGTLALFAHAPCGMAGEYAINFEDVIRLLKLAKARVLEEIPDMIVACFIHIDRNGAGKDIRFLDGASWRKWEALTIGEREQLFSNAVMAPASGGEAY